MQANRPIKYVTPQDARNEIIQRLSTVKPNLSRDELKKEAKQAMRKL